MCCSHVQTLIAVVEGVIEGDKVLNLHTWRPILTCGRIKAQGTSKTILTVV